MSLANISLLDSFTGQFIRLNQVLIVINALLTGQSNLDGSLVLTNSSKLSGNVTINVASGLIKGDGGLLSNVRSSSLSQNTINISSNSSLIVLSSNSIALGGNTIIYVTPANRANDNSVSNVATAYTTNLVHGVAVAAFSTANAASNIGLGAFSTANAAAATATVAGTQSAAAFDAANSAFTEATASFGQANTGITLAIAAFAQANSEPKAVAAFGQANTGVTNAAGALGVGQGAFAQANGAATSASTALAVGQAAFGSSNTVNAAAAKYAAVGLFTKSQVVQPVTLTDAATVAVDLGLGNSFKLVIGGNRTLGLPTNIVAGQFGSIEIKQDGTGSRTLAYNAIWKFASGIAPILSTGANVVDRLDYWVSNSSFIHASVSYNIS